MPRNLASRSLTTLAALLGAASVFAQSSLFRVEISGRSRDAGIQAAESAYRLYRDNLFNLTASNRAKRSNAPYIMPAIVRLTQNGQPLATGGRTRGNEITLSIDSSFNTAGDPGRVAFMQSVYNTAKPAIEAVFGDAAITGLVNVVNADATIGDRHAITGGFYLPNNGSGAREIRLPLNASREVAAISLIHCILLAYLPDPTYGFDTYLEGLVRAATQKIVRVPANLPAGLEQDVIESVLEQTYEIGAFYDWTNQKSLSGTRFIAPNLVSTPISQGTRGGLFFQRYQMAGSVWEKVLAEHPNFIKNFNLAFRTNPAAANNASSLVALGSTVIGAGTVEGDTFATWVRKQHILDTRNTIGTKLHTFITPITNGLSNPDFGVFNIEATAFSTDASGNETLLSGTSYPVFWDKDYNRILPSAQSERIDIAASYGSVVPNFADENAGIPYRVAVDVPFQDRITRQYIPAGSIATPASASPSDFYGTVIGLLTPGGSTMLVRMQAGSEIVDAPVTNFAFGKLIGTANFLGTRSLIVKVITKNALNVETTVLTRVVNKGPGPLALELGAAPVSSTSFGSSVPAGVSMIGITGDPLSTALEDVLGIPATTFLAARYNPAKTNYDLYPNSGAVHGGQAYFVRLPGSVSSTWQSRLETRTAVAIALRPGWNMVTCPLGVETNFANVEVVRTTNFPRTYLGASGNDAGDTESPILGKDAFQFVQGANDPFSGLPEGGSYAAATKFTPGAGYFIRCLAPEGVTMLFKLASSSSSGLTQPINPDFVIQNTVARGKDVSSAFAGMSARARNTFDAAYDSNLPPSFGGLQLSIANTDRRYKDIRAMADTATYRIFATGCQVGKVYSYSFNVQRGRAFQIQIKNLANNQILTYTGTSGTFNFQANSTQMGFDLTVKGAR